MRVKLIIILFIFCRCNKGWMDERSDKQLTTPGTVAELQALLDNNSVFNGSGNAFGLQEFLETGTDNVYLRDNTYTSFKNSLPYLMNAYAFEKDVFAGKNNVTVWNIPYKRIFTANIIIESSLTPEYNQVKAQALFHRAHTFYWLSQAFCKPYLPSTESTDPGIVLRLSSDPEETMKRSSVGATYKQMISDLSTAMQVLPVTGNNITRPTRTAAAALLSRIYLCMNNYQQAELYADTALLGNAMLVDYNTLDSVRGFPINRNNSEIIFMDINRTSLYQPLTASVDTVLLASYQENDLRKALYFRRQTPATTYGYRGSYDQSASIFGGIILDEVMLTKAECLARRNENEEALMVLNTLLEKRWRAGSFMPLTATDVLSLILNERRKELCFRGLRWTDLRRLNIAGGEIAVTHYADGSARTLSPNDSKWVYPIPDDIINFTGIQQNIR